ncbi:MAG: SDR family NAD(P)-dependent oxidoreductase [Burkholderiales bacterium]|nr:SDR family NAD(P)-dependent oxidoreductase [Burkholderiales bacterium]
MSSLTGKVVLITGAASGIGEATALEVMSRGAITVLVDCDSAPLARVAQKCGNSTTSFVADITDLNALQDAVRQTILHYGRIDIVFANAGIAAFGPLAHMDPLAWKRCVEVNVMGLFNTLHVALPELIQHRGYVLINASVSSFAHPPLMSAYAASKSAVEAIANSCRIEMSAHGVDVGVFYASWVSTPLVTEGSLHPGFIKLRNTMPRLLNKEITPETAAASIANGMEKRMVRIWLPGWVKYLFVFRSLLHLKIAEYPLRKVTPEIENIYLAGLASDGALASCVGPREHARLLAHMKDPKND